MPERVVDILESIEVEQQYGKRTVLSGCTGYRLIQTVIIQGSVGQPCQLVMHRLVVHALGKLYQGLPHFFKVLRKTVYLLYIGRHTDFVVGFTCSNIPGPIPQFTQRPRDNPGKETHQEQGYNRVDTQYHDTPAVYRFCLFYDNRLVEPELQADILKTIDRYSYRN